MIKERESATDLADKSELHELLVPHYRYANAKHDESCCDMRGYASYGRWAWEFENRLYLLLLLLYF